MPSEPCGHYERGGREQREVRQAGESVDHAVGRVDLRRTDGIVQRRVGGEDTRDDQPGPKQTQQDWRRDRVRPSPQADREGDDERAAHQEVDDLDPASRAGCELADVMAPGAVARPRQAFDEEDDDEQRRAD